METDDPAVLAIRDKSNLVAGTIHLEAEEFALAIPYLNRVRIDGPFSNQALLSAGWANMAIDNAERAVVPWSILAEREATDNAAQEAMLALPYAYGTARCSWPGGCLLRPSARCIRCRDRQTERRRSRAFVKASSSRH